MHLAMRGVSTPSPDAIGLPAPFQPSAPAIENSDGVIRAYILPDGKTGAVSEPCIIYLPFAHYFAILETALRGYFRSR